MRILLDEDLPRRLGASLSGHEVSTVQRCGWSGIKNGKLLALAATKFDVFLTMDGNLEYQQNLSKLPIAVLVVTAVSNRMEHLVPVVQHPARAELRLTTDLAPRWRRMRPGALAFAAPSRPNRAEATTHRRMASRFIVPAGG
jgi:predicted nuclease of predicted toxin-antitoxin system